MAARKKAISIDGPHVIATRAKALNSSNEFRHIYQQAKSEADGGFVVFYAGNTVYSVFFDEMRIIEEVSGIIPSPVPPYRTLRLNISLKAFDRYVSAVKELGYKVWLWTSTDGVGQI